MQWEPFVSWLAAPERAWAEAYAVGLYLHLRPGELHELRVKLAVLAGEVRIHRAYNKLAKTVKTPKTDEGIRTVTIPPTLMPLLERIARERGADDRVCPIVAETSEIDRAGFYRAHFQAAGVDDPSPFIETATHLPIDFRSLRDSGVSSRESRLRSTISGASKLPSRPFRLFATRGRKSRERQRRMPTRA